MTGRIVAIIQFPPDPRLDDGGARHVAVTKGNGQWMYEFKETAEAQRLHAEHITKSLPWMLINTEDGETELLEAVEQG